MSTTTITFRVRYEWDPRAKAWSAVSDAGPASWARTLAGARSSIREAIELWLDLPDDQHLNDIDVSVIDEVSSLESGRRSSSGYVGLSK